MLPDYLWECAPARLSEFNLSRQNRAAELRRELLALLTEYVEAEAEAGAVAFIVAARRAAAVPKKPLQKRLDFAAPAKRHAERRRTA